MAGSASEDAHGDLSPLCNTADIFVVRDVTINNYNGNIFYVMECQSLSSWCLLRSLIE